MRFTTPRHFIYTRGVTRTECGRTYQPDHTSLIATADPGRVTCGTCRRSREFRKRTARPLKNVTPR